MSTVAPCACKPWQQSWRAETPGVCATCGRQFSPYLRAREVCLKAEECLLLPDHDGPCDSNPRSIQDDMAHLHAFVSTVYLGHADDEAVAALARVEAEHTRLRRVEEAARGFLEACDEHEPEIHELDAFVTLIEAVSDLPDTSNVASRLTEAAQGSGLTSGNEAES